MLASLFGQDLLSGRFCSQLAIATHHDTEATGQQGEGTNRTGAQTGRQTSHKASGGRRVKPERRDTDERTALLLLLWYAGKHPYLSSGLPLLSIAPGLFCGNPAPPARVPWGHETTWSGVRLPGVWGQHAAGVGGAWAARMVPGDPARPNLSGCLASADPDANAAPDKR